MTGGGSGGSSGGGGGGGEGGGGDTSIVDWANITSKPTTISGYGITDAYISGGAIYLGGNSITPLVSGDLNGYATQQWVGQQGFLTSSAISDMATQTWVGQQGFLTSSAISDMATQTWVLQQRYITSSAISDMATKTWVGQQNYLTSSALSNYVQKSQTVGLLKNDGTVDTNTYLTSIPSNYVSVNNDGIFSHQIITDNQLFVYGGNGYLYGSIVIGDNNGGVVDMISTNELGQLTWGSDSVVMSSDISDMATKTWVGQHFSHGHSVHGGLTSGHPVVGDNDFSRWDMPFTFDPADGGTVIPAFLPLSGGILSSTLEIATGGDRKLVLNNTDNELWNVISFQDNGTEVGYLGLCGSNALAWNQHEVLLAGYDNNIINHGNEFTFVSAGYGSDVSEFPNGRMVWFNYRTASGNLDGNISSYKFGDGKGGELAEITNGQFSGNAASATKALKVVQGNNDRLVTNANGVTAVGDNNNSTIGFRTDGSAHYEPYIMIRKTLDGNNSAEFHLDYYTANGGHYFKDATSGYADVYAKSFVIHDTSYPNVSVSMSADFASGYVHFTSGMRGYIFDAPVTQSSDARLKNIVSHAGFEVNKLATLPLVWFTWKKDERRRMHFGSIAQEWQKVLPEVVSENGDGMLAMDYGAAAMAAGVTACREVVRLKAEIERLKGMINNK